MILLILLVLQDLTHSLKQTLQIDIDFVAVPQGSSDADHPMSQDAPSEYSEEKGGQNAGDSKPKGRRRRVQTEYQQMLNKAAQKRYR